MDQGSGSSDEEAEKSQSLPDGADLGKKSGSGEEVAGNIDNFPDGTDLPERPGSDDEEAVKSRNLAEAESEKGPSSTSW